VNIGPTPIGRLEQAGRSWLVIMPPSTVHKRPQWLFEDPYFTSLNAAIFALARSGYVVDFWSGADGQKFPIYQLKPIDTKTQPN
jgi:hypothetical protein